MTVNSRILQWLVPVFVAAGIGISMSAGWWITESTKEPARFTTGDFEGQANPADIRGSYSLVDITNAFGIPVETLAEAFGLPPDSGLVQVKAFEELYGEIGDREIGTDAMRLFVARYLGLPYNPEEDTALLQTGVDLIVQARSDPGTTLSQDELADLQERIVTPGVPLPSDDAAVEEGDAVKMEDAVETEYAVETEDAVPSHETVAAEDADRGEVNAIDADHSTAAVNDADVDATAIQNAVPDSGLAPVSDEHAEDTEFLVKGQTTFGQLLLWGVPRQELETVMGGEIGPRTMLVRDFCVETGISFSTVKTRLQELVDEYRTDD